MGYSTVSDIEKIIAAALTSATNPTSTVPGDLLRVGKVFDKNLIPTDTVEFYIARGDEEINASISQMYIVPICEIADWEGKLFSDVDEYNIFLVLDRACPLNPGDVIILKYREVEERHVIDEIIAADTFSTVEPIQFAFPAGTRVVRVKFPDPIRITSARLSAANIYDKFFASQTSPNTSEYGKYVRDQARQELNNIRNGGTILHGQHRIGRRFWNPTLDDRYALPALEGTERNLGPLTQG